MNKLQTVKFTDNDFELDVRADSENETMWLSVEEMSTLFERDRTVISRHIKNVFNEKELDGDSLKAGSEKYKDHEDAA